MKFKCIFLSAAVLLLCLTASGCGRSIELAAGSFDERTESLSAVISKDELPLLDGFTELKALDLTGSTCYDAIADWAKAHPDIEVTYSVIMPDGQSLAPDIESIDLSAVPAEPAKADLDTLIYFPKLRSVELGVLNGRFSPEDIKSFTVENSGITLTGQVDMLGEKYDMYTESFDLSRLSHENAAEVLAAMRYFADIKSIDLGSEEMNDLSFDDVAAFEDAFPEAEFSYDFTLFGTPCSVNTKKVNLSQIKMDDNGEAVRAALRCMKKCDYLDMDSCGVDSEHMAEIRDEFPQIEVVWRVFFGWNYTARTNTDRILASAWSGEGELGYGNEEELKYCTKVRYLDIGHNMHLDNIDFVAYMPDLEVLITYREESLKDISPLANCKKLEYLELIYDTDLTDLSPIAGLTELRHLNIAGSTRITDITPLYGLTKLERLWISGYNTAIPREQIEEIRELLPDCVVDSEGGALTGSGNVGWRVDHDDEDNKTWNPRYYELRETFGYKNSPYCYNYTYNDPYCYSPYPTPPED